MRLLLLCFFLYLHDKFERWHCFSVIYNYINYNKKIQTTQMWKCKCQVVINCWLSNLFCQNYPSLFYSFTIQNVHQNSEIFWKYNRYTLIREYYERPMFPVPIIIHIWRFVRWCLFTIFDIHQKDLFCEFHVNICSHVTIFYHVIIN